MAMALERCEFCTTRPREEVAVLRWRFAILGEQLGGGGGVIFIHITHGQNVAKPAGVLRVRPAHAAATHQRDAGAVVGAERLGGYFGGGQFVLDEPQWQSCRGGGGGAGGKKGAARNLEGV